MSNYLAVAAATATIARQMKNALDGAAGLGATVTTGPPPASPPADSPTVNLFLAWTAVNAGWANADLGFRDSSGRLTEIPTAALTLHYVLTFYGREAELEPQQLLGVVAGHFHSEPYLTRQMVSDATADAAFAYISASDLADQPELVRLTPARWTLDELSRLWTALPAGSFGLSMGYEAAPVLVQPLVEASAPLPVLRAEITVAPNRAPHITGVAPLVAHAVVEAGATIVVRGTGLAYSALHVEIDGAPLPAGAVGAVKAESIEVTLPSDLPAGTHGLEVVHVYDVSAAGTEQSGRSGLASFVLHPRVDAASVVPAGDVLEVTVTPPIGPRQRATVSLDPDPAVGGPTVTLPATAKPIPVPPPVHPPAPVLEADLAGVGPGTYRVRVRVGGADSIPPLVAGKFAWTTVDVP